MTSDLPTWRLVGMAVALAVSSCAPTIDAKDRANARIHYDMAVASLARADQRGALRELLIAADLNPTMPQVRNALGLVYHALGKLDEALSQYEEAIRLKPTFSEAYNNMGTLLIDLGRYEDAVAAFKVALADILYPTPSLAEGNMGWAYYRQGNVTLAERHLRNAVAASPTFCRGYEWLARIALDQGDGKSAVASIGRFDKHCRNNPKIAADIPPRYLVAMQYYLGLAHLKQGDLRSARGVFESCAAETTADDFAGQCQASLERLPR